MKNSLMLCGLALSIFGTSFSAKSQTLSAHLRQKLEQENRILDQEVQKSLQSMHIRSDFRDASTYATEDDGKIVLSTDLLSGDTILVKVSTPIPGPIPWADMNGNNKYDKGEELVGDYKTKTKLTVKNSSITLYGDFYALNLPNAKITNIDVSKVKNLWYLLVPQNQISTIDLSKNSGLRFLELSVNRLTSLDLSKNEQISTLAAAANQLSSIDLSRSSGMKKCWIYGNQISSIALPPQFYSMADVDVSANYISGDLMDQFIQKLPNLQGIPHGGVIVVIDTKEPTEQNVCYKSSVKEAKDKNWAVKNNDGNPAEPKDYAGTDKPVYAPIDGPSIDFTTALSSATDSLNVGVFQLDKSKTAWIDLNGNKICDEGEALSKPSVNKYKFTSQHITIYGKVSVLNLKKNKLTSLNVSNCPDLMVLSVYDNKLQTLDVTHNKNLGKLYCDHNELTSLDLSNSSNLVDLDCSFNNLTQIDVTKCSNITHLSLMSNKLNVISLDAEANKYLRNININGNAIGAEAMGTIIDNLPSLQPSDDAIIVVIDTKANPKDQNVCTVSQVKKALAKNWKIMDYNGNAENRQPYNGSEDIPQISYAPSDGPMIELTTTTPLNESITIFVKQAKENENQVAWVDLDGDNSAEPNEALAPGKNKIKVGNSSMKVYGNFVKFEAKGANLSDINVQKATALDTLNLFKNALTSLDLSKNVSLTDLDVANNALTALDLSNNFGLMSLNCAVNKLTSLDLSPNAALKVVTAYKNELTSISFNSAADSKLNKVVINSNKIDATEMAKIVKSLPARSVSDKAQIVVINTKDDAEGNVCTKSDVATAKGKNWMVKDFNGSYKKMVDYEGSTPKAASATPVDGKTKIIISTTSVKNQYEVQLPTSALHQMLRLFDLTGRQLLSLPITQQKMIININALPCGIYLMHINGQTQKIVKE